MKFRYINEVKYKLLRYYQTRCVDDNVTRKLMLGMFGGNEILADRFMEHVPILNKMFPGNWSIEVNEIRAVNKTDTPTENKGRMPSASMIYHTRLHAIYVRRFKLIVRYPELTVVSEDEGSVDIKDLYMSWQFDVSYTANEWFISRVAGIRTTLPFDHYAAGYLHSHLSSVSVDDVPTWSGFCLSSSGTALTNQVLISNPMHYTMPNFQMHLLNCKMLARTQYCSGSPPNRMKNINSSEYDLASERISARERNRSYRNIICLL